VLLGKGKKEAGTLKRLTEAYTPELFLPDFNSALGITQIKTVERFIERRKEIAQVFSRAVMQSRHKILIQKGEGENIYYSFPIVIDSGMKDVQSYARKKGIETKPAFTGSIIAFLPEDERKWPVAASLLLRCLLFPLYPTLTKLGIGQIEKVLTTLP
jgi:dTDP-4-amino-4,6-dideoxygalactose transaminase